MSRAIVEFCHGLETTLLAIEDRLDKAAESLAAGAHGVEAQAKHQVEEASAHLAAFRAKAGALAKALREDISEDAEEIEARLSAFGAEAQTAMRHAVVFLAESTAKGAVAGASALSTAGAKAQGMADQVRLKTALTAPTADEILPT
jgi:F0F1-type ATP synthase membrane subunit b/b'